jgi:hypothetical protein
MRGFKKKCGVGRKSKKCLAKPKKRRSDACDMSSIAGMLDSAGFAARWARDNKVELARAKDKYLLANRYARNGGKSCQKRWAAKFAAFRKTYPEVLRARVRDASGQGRFDPFG